MSKAARSVWVFAIYLVVNGLGFLIIFGAVDLAGEVWTRQALRCSQG